MSRIVIYPYKLASGSAKALAETVRTRGYPCLRVYPNGMYRKRSDDIVINWGSHTVPDWDTTDMINSIESVTLAGNKLETLRVLNEAGIPTLESTTDAGMADAWLQHDGMVVERQLLNASGGRGIVLHKYGESKGVGKSPLYTRYFKKAREYRVHVAGGEVIDWQQKMVKKEHVDDVNYQIRNHDNGWIFAREAATPLSNTITRVAVDAVSALGLSFGAVDVGWNDRRGACAVFEVNTAPGLTGETLNSYANFLIDNYEDRR